MGDVKNEVKGKAGGEKDTVKFRLFKDSGKYQDDVFVGVNGKAYIVKRGVDVELPRSVYNVLKDAEEQMIAANEYSEQQQKKTQE